MLYAAGLPRSPEPTPCECIEGATQLWPRTHTSLLQIEAASDLFACAGPKGSLTDRSQPCPKGRERLAVQVSVTDQQLTRLQSPPDAK